MRYFFLCFLQQPNPYDLGGGKSDIAVDLGCTENLSAVDWVNAITVHALAQHTVNAIPFSVFWAKNWKRGWKLVVVSSYADCVNIKWFIPMRSKCENQLPFLSLKLGQCENQLSLDWVTRKSAIGLDQANAEIISAHTQHFREGNGDQRKLSKMAG